jgi:hypothetical protein
VNEVNDMSQEESKSSPVEQGERQPFRVRLPRFITGDEEIGLGDAIKRATASVGIQPCGGCAERAARLNRWVVFTGGRSR